MSSSHPSISGDKPRRFLVSDLRSMKAPLGRVIRRSSTLVTNKLGLNRKSGSFNRTSVASDAYQPFSHSPVELWLQIFFYLPSSDIRALSLTCRAIRDVAQPSLFRKLILHPYSFENPPTSRGLITRHNQSSPEKRVSRRLEFFLSSRIAIAVKECWIVPSATDQYKRSMPVDDVVDIIFNSLPRFQNLTKFVCHFLDLTLVRVTILRGLSLKELTLQSCSLDDHTSLYSSPMPLQTVSLVYPTGYTMTVLPALLLHPEHIQRLFSGPTAVILPTLALAEPLHRLSDLDIPSNCVTSPDFIPALSRCPGLKRLSLHKADVADSEASQPPPKSLPPDILPSLIYYRGPRTFLPLIANGRALKSISLVPTCSSEQLAKTLRNLAPGAGDNVDTLSLHIQSFNGYLLPLVHSSFPTLLSLSIKGTVPKGSHWLDIMNTVEVHPTIRSLRLDVDVSDPFNFWKPNSEVVGDARRYFEELHPALIDTYPSLYKVQLVYTEEGASLVWRRYRSGKSRQIEVSDIQVEVDVHTRSSVGRPLLPAELPKR